MKGGEGNPDPVVVLMTDFGVDDTYVGQMKGVILSICPHARIVDLTHAIAPQHIELGAFFLDRALPFLPQRSIVVCVVDPGVGTSRKPLALRTGHHTFLGPDNGLLTPVLDMNGLSGCVSITNHDIMLTRQSATFHGRDLFSPAAAHLAGGFPFGRLGEPVAPSSCVRLPAKGCRVQSDGSIAGHILFADRFGNLVTTIDTSLCANPREWRIETEGIPPLSVMETYGDKREGELLAYGGSFGTVEIAVRNGSAAERTGVREGAAARLVRVAGTTAENREAKA